ncbi:MAG TPA: helix-turn-helix domain-containing protein [Thermomicrobiales bacterium]|nr:helix-turn-helix domain-containing protein [Thermomicrobiales bacterium]
MHSYGQFCPVAKAAEIFAERWTPLIMREILLGSTRFNELERGLPRISRSVLSQRLKQLEHEGIIDRRVGLDGRSVEYIPTQIGQELYDVIRLLGEWGARWLNEDIDPQDIDPTLLMWDMHRRIERDRLPDRQIIARFDYTGLRQKSFWLILNRHDVSVCYFDPGFDVDLVATVDTQAMHRIWMGHQTFESALRTGQMRIDGPRELASQLPSWFQLSIFAHVPRARAA